MSMDEGYAFRDGKGTVSYGKNIFAECKNGIIFNWNRKTIAPATLHIFWFHGENRKQEDGDYEQTKPLHEQNHCALGPFLNRICYKTYQELCREFMIGAKRVNLHDFNMLDRGEGGTRAAWSSR
jgi:hypothetical protein